jgi:hypothetical protein
VSARTVAYYAAVVLITPMCPCMEELKKHKQHVVVIALARDMPMCSRALLKLVRDPLARGSSLASTAEVRECVYTYSALAPQNSPRNLLFLFA